MRNSLITLLRKCISTFSSVLTLGSGATWPGHIALKLNKNFLKETISDKTKIVLVAGTNGKTTTATMITHLLIESGFSVAHNKTGANQLNGVPSAIIKDLPLFSSVIKNNYLILEVDENVLPILLSQIKPEYIICLNLFRDQLDRYGEIGSIITKWKTAFKKLENKIIFILNSDDPQVSYLANGLKNKALFFGLNEKNDSELEHGADSIYCPNCLSNLEYDSITFSHLGNWKCTKCEFKRKKPNLDSWDFYPLEGTYNKYNTLASVLFAIDQKVDKFKISENLKSFKPAFGRQEEFESNGRKVKIFLSKNPTSFNQSLNTIVNADAKNILILLNDRFVDGQDVSWIWDTNVSQLTKIPNITISGERAYDMALRVKYSENKKIDCSDSLENSVKLALDKTPKDDTLFVLPTYSAMLDVRKILKGNKIS